MSLHTIEFIIGSITLLFAYFLSVTMVGTFEAAVARWAGDDTPSEAFNPFNYFDMIGFLCVMTLGIGWGKQNHFHPDNITPPHRSLKALLVYASGPFASLILALIALIGNVFLVGQRSLQFAFWSLFAKGIPLQKLAATYPDASSFTLVVVIFLLALIGLNTFIATWSMINNAFHYILFIGAEHGYDYMKHAEALAFFGPLVMLLLFTGPLRFLLLRIIITFASLIGYCCGIIS